MDNRLHGPDGSYKVEAIAVPNYWQYRSRRGWRGRMTEQEARRQAAACNGRSFVRPVFVLYGHQEKIGTLDHMEARTDDD